MKPAGNGGLFFVELLSRGVVESLSDNYLFGNLFSW